MSFKVEDSAISLVYLMMTVWPDSCFIKSQQRVHAHPQKMGTVFALYGVLKHLDCRLHILLELNWRQEGFVGSDLHNMQLKFFAEAEAGHFDRVDNASMKVFEYLVNYRQGFQLVID